jgi:CMP-N,N'-diacetyllegionaminic acid synthase
MFNDFSLLAVIPARSGSKGLIDKNIMQCAGKPLIEWSISAAKDVDFFDDVIVSTDSETIATIARNAGASVPFIRPEEFASDDASIISVIKHAWENHRTFDGKSFDYIVILQPTSPLRDVLHINSAIKLYFEKYKSENDTLASVYKVDKKNAWLMQSDTNDEYINFCLKVDLGNPQRQKLVPLYLPNGSIYILKGESIDNGIYHKRTIPFLMDVADSEDVDTIEDFQRAENALFKKIKSKSE